MEDNNQSNPSNQQINNQTIDNQNNERASFKAFGTYTPKQPVPPPPGEEGVQTALKHSGLGITSFIFAIFSLLLIVASIIVMVINIASISESDIAMFSDPYYVEQMILSGEIFSTSLIGIIFAVFMLLSVGFFGLIGSIFGIISLFMKNRKKVFGIIGTIVNGLLCFGGIIFFIISILSSFAA